MTVTTVYFDTCFFVWLAHAQEALARDIVSRLNAARVRCVCSPALLLELLANTGNQAADLRLVRRLKELSLPPLGLDPLFDFELLADHTDARADFAKEIVERRVLAVAADSIAIVAAGGAGRTGDRPPDRATTVAMVEAHRPALEAAGVLVGNTLDLSPAMANAREFEGLLGPALGELLRLPSRVQAGEIDHTQARTESARLLAELNAQLARVRPQVAEERRTKVDAFAGSDHPRQIATGESSKTARRKTPNTLRDAEHVAVFIAHRARIDLLQMDGPQYGKLCGPNPEKSRLLELSLTKRCFCASSLLDAVEIVELWTREEQEDVRR